LAWRPLAATGLISYGLYLWHFPILLDLEGHLHGVVERVAVPGVATFLAAIVSWRYLERPIQARSRRWLAERRTARNVAFAPVPVETP
jgi:peptidoglycan/LPS O-acetylase OafA/YrhL